jgi:hypothetical protein
MVILVITLIVKGVKARRPFFSFLFDLVADVLHILLYNAQRTGFIKGLGEFGELGQVLNLYFAHHTLFF